MLERRLFLIGSAETCEAEYVLFGGELSDGEIDFLRQLTEKTIEEDDDELPMFELVMKVLDEFMKKYGKCGVILPNFQIPEILI